MSRRDNPINRNHPTRFPYVDELMRDPTVIAALNQAWRDTNADTIPVTAACEQGGWIYMNLSNGRLTIVRKENRLGAPTRPGQNQQGYLNINLNDPPVIAGSAVVATFHTHPSVPFTGPSGVDIQLGIQHGVPGIVRGRDGQHAFTGPVTGRRSDTISAAASSPQFPR